MTTNKRTVARLRAVMESVTKPADTYAPTPFVHPQTGELWFRHGTPPGLVLWMPEEIVP